MPLIERLIATGPGGPKIPVHQFQAIVGEWARGQLTAAQAQEAIRVASRGGALDAAGIAEVQALIATVPTGQTTANKVDRLLRLLEIDQVLLMADRGIPPYNDPTFLRSRLGI